MANKTIYVPDDDVEVFERCKAVAGKSLSSVILNALKQYLVQKEAEGSGMQEFNLWVGVENLSEHAGRIEGKRIVFVGAELAEFKDDLRNENITIRVFKTQKGKYIVHTVILDKEKMECESYYTRYEDFKELSQPGRLPGQLLNDLQKVRPDIELEILDV